MIKKTTCLLLACIMMAGFISAPAIAADAPVVKSLTLYAAKNTNKSIDLTTALEDGSTADAYAITKNPSSGSIVRTNPAVQGIYTYKPNDGFTGTDTIQFTASDGGVVSNVGTVTINVVNPGPIARNSSINAVKGKSTTAAVDVVEPSDLDLTFDIRQKPSKGTVTTPTANTGAFTYTAEPDATGTDTFTYIAINSAGLESNVATVTITFVAGNPTAESKTITALKETAKRDVVKATDPVYTDSDLTFELVVGPANGTFVPKGIPSDPSDTSGDAVDFVNDGDFYYVGNKDYVGTDSFTFRAVNPDTLKSNVAKVTINVGTGKPTVENVSIQLVMNDVAKGKLIGHDPADDTGANLTYTIDEQPSRGTITEFNNKTGAFTYDPDKDVVGTDTFKYSVSNATLKSDLGTVTITIAPESYDPIEYSDMKTHWAHEAVGILGAMDMIKGEEIQNVMYFRPNEKMNRSDFVIFLNAVMEIAPDTSATSLFDDVTEPWLIPVLNAAKNAGVTAGITSGGKTNFNPYGSLSRVEAVVFVANVLDLPDVNVDLDYKDKDKIPSWALQHMKNMSAYEILSGYDDGTFRPNDPVSRAEAAVMLLKTYRERLLQRSMAADMNRSAARARIMTDSDEVVFQSGIGGYVRIDDQGKSRVQNRSGSHYNNNVNVIENARARSFDASDYK